jgi:hypothetical protein
MDATTNANANANGTGAGPLAGLNPDAIRAQLDELETMAARLRAVLPAEVAQGEMDGMAATANGAARTANGAATAANGPAATNGAAMQNGPAAMMGPGAPSDDVFAAVCSVRSEEGGYPLAAQVGLPAAVCAAWQGMSGEEREACVHTFSNANTSLLRPSMVQMCGAAVGDALGISESELMTCVRAPALGQGLCMTALRGPLVLADNAPMAEQLQREEVRQAQALTGEPEAVRRVKLMAAKEAPTRDDVYDLVSLCRWDRGTPQDARANEILAETFLGLPAGQRAICTEANNFCGAIDSVNGICHAVQHKVGTNAYVAKVDDFYAGGEFSGSDQRLALTMQLYPEPYGGAFSEVALACGLDRSQAEVARTLLATSRGDVARNREICRRIEEGVGALPRMTSDVAQVASMLAGGMGGQRGRR